MYMKSCKKPLDNKNNILAKNLPGLVSAHGGHSGQFCCHAKDRLEDIIKEYIGKGFLWVGITEHMPPAGDKYLYPDEIACGLNAQTMKKRFEAYTKECKRLKEKYASRIKILVGFETEAYDGAIELAQKLMAEFEPDYIVGSVHHVNNIPIDETKENYLKAVKSAGSTDNLYCRYFDIQYELINALNPEITGHFDLIRIFDPDYKMRLKKPRIWKRICRNLDLIKNKNLALDLNVRAFLKGADEPYPSLSILKKAAGLGIKAFPGDDSHGVKDVGLNIEKGMAFWEKANFSETFLKPVYPVKSC